MIIDGITTVDGRQIDATELASIDTASAGNLASQLPGSNIMYNGKMQISQRGTWSAQPVTTGEYYFDRFKIQLITVTATVDASTLVYDGDTFESQLITATSSGTGTIQTRQSIERFNDYKNKTVTLSAVVKSNSTNARLRIYDGVNSTYSTGHSGNGQPELLSVTVTVDSAATLLFGEFDFIGSAGQNVSITSGDYFEFTDVRMDLGDQRLSGDRQHGEELLLCQRYYCYCPGNFFGGQYATSNSFAQYFYPVHMRTNPTLTYSLFGGGSVITNYSNSLAVQLYISDPSVSIGSLRADAEM